MNRKPSPTIIVVAILAALCGLSLYLRIHLGHSSIFVGDAVWFRETDAYYYLRNIESVVHNFPHFNTFDPYMLFPGGGGLSRPFFTWLVAAAALIVGGGNPTTHAIATVSAYLPPILGTLTLIPVYFIGKELFNRWAGLIAAALVTILPGEFMHRSLLGFTDHHVAEVLFTTVFILFLIMAVKRAREREISFTHIRSRDWATVRRPLVYALLAGIFLGIYLLTWTGGVLFVFVAVVYLVIQFIVDHLRRKSTDYLGIIGTPLFLVAFLMVLPILVRGSLDTISLASLLVAIAIPIVLSFISRLMAGRAWKPVYYPLTLLGLAGIGLAAFHAINPSLLQSMLSRFSIFAPSGAMLTVMEVSPLLFPYGQFSFQMAWANFNASFFIAFVAIAMLIYVIIRGKSVDKTLFLVWSIVMLMAVLGQRRFAYYYTVNAALLTGYFSWKMLDIAGLNKLLTKSKGVVQAVKKFKKRRKKTKEKAKPRTFMQPRGTWVRVIIAGILLFVVVFLPSIPSTKALAGSPNYIMNEGWYASLLWLKDNTPDPFDDPDFYYELYPSQSEFQYPDTMYAVLSWWDYGYFIMQIGHRVPNSNPGQAGAKEAGQFFTAQNETSANELADQLMSKYVVIDSDMATGKFYAMVEWAGGNMSEFSELCYVLSQDGKQLNPVVLYYPAYYRSTAVRLYLFDGQAVVPTESLVVQYDNRVDSNGVQYRLITGAWQFSTYEEAEAYIAEQGPGNYRIASSNPLTSPVPLDAMADYELVYSSPAGVSVVDQVIPGVKVFEYLGFPLE